MRGSLSPSVLAKNKRIEVFRLVSERTDFSSEKLSCTRSTSEGICFAKQSEQWLTKPLLSQAKLARACPTFRPILYGKRFIILIAHKIKKRRLLCALLCFRRSDQQGGIFFDFFKIIKVYIPILLQNFSGKNGFFFQDNAVFQNIVPIIKKL